MQERYRRAVEHASAAIGRSSHYAFEQAKHATHIADPVEGRNKMHFRCARVGKTDIYVILQKGSEQALRTIHE